MRDLPAGTVTFLFTDIEGSTKLLHELGADRYADALAEHRRILRQAFTEHGGVEVDTQGDAFFIAFAEAGEALAAAREAREALEAGPIRVRMGLYTGEPTLTAEGYVGLGVHAGARVAAASHGGQIICSRRTKELAGEAFEFVDLGEHRLKDLAEPVWIYQLGEGLFPPLKTLSNTNLPSPASSFIGREHELEEAGVLLERSRLFTIVGPGGAGKTRFSMELASRQLERFPNGVFWVGLANLRDPALVLETAAKTVGSKNGLAEHVGERQMLILLDNLEQVIESAPEIAVVVESCPNLTILITSRESMRVRGERTYALPPLEIDEGVSLFCERASIEPSEPIAELCRRLDGLPLAIELAAARTSVLTPDQLVERLGERLDLLRGGRDADARQRTLRATIEWSFDLLDEGERSLFARLAVFAGGCTLETATAIADADLDTLQSLVEKSLVRRTDERFWMLETIREFAVERLEVFGEAEHLKQRHAEFMLAVAESANLTSEAPGAQHHDLVIREQDNMRAAIEWAIASGRAEFGLGLAIALENFWATHNPSEGVRWFSRLLEGAGEIEPALRARALRDLGGSTDLTGDMDRAAELYAESLELFRSLGDQRNVGELIHRQAVVAVVTGDVERGRSLLKESLEIALAVGNRWGECQAIGTLAHIARADGDMKRAAELFTQSAEIAVEIGNVWWETGMLTNLTELDLIAGRIDEAAARNDRTTKLARANGDRSTLTWCLLCSARIASARGDLSQAGMLLGAAEAEEAQGPAREDPDRVVLVAPLLAIDDPAFDRGRSEGRRLSLDEAVDRSLSN